MCTVGELRSELAPRGHQVPEGLLRWRIGIGLWWSGDAGARQARSDRMKRVKTALALLSAWALLVGAILGVAGAQGPFNEQLMTPNGISIEDVSGNVTIHSEGILQGIPTTLLTTFAPDGTQLRQTMIGDGPIDALRFLNSRLAADPDPLADRLYLLSPEGDIVSFTASTLEEIGRFNIQDLTVDTSDVYDVAIEDSSSAFVMTAPAIYGDIAAYRPDDDFTTPMWLVTGFAEGTAFVMRIPMADEVGNVMQASVILMSSTPSPLTLRRPRGVAVGPGGDALTTLPIPASISDCPDAVIHFNAKSPFLSEDDVSDLPGSAGVPSWGMDANASGFFITTGGVANAACLQSGSISLVFIANTLTGIDANHIISLSSAFPAGEPGDVAFSSNPVDLMYASIVNFGSVVRLPTSILQLP